MIKWFLSLFKKKKPLIDFLPAQNFTKYADYSKEDINKILEEYNKNAKFTTKPSCFYYNGIRYDKDTPEELWGDLFNELEIESMLKQNQK
jgi:hypothetical protein